MYRLLWICLKLPQLGRGPKVFKDETWNTLGSKCYYRWDFSYSWVQMLLQMGPLLHLGSVISLVLIIKSDLVKRTEKVNTIVKSHCLGDLVTPILGLSAKLLFDVILSAFVRRTRRRESNRRRDAVAVNEREISHVRAYLSVKNNYAWSRKKIVRVDCYFSVQNCLTGKFSVNIGFKTFLSKLKF